jgi:putative heme-binding domain-containing protein
MMRNFSYWRQLLRVACLLPAAAGAQTPQWIWSPPAEHSQQTEVRFFRKTFTAPNRWPTATLSASGDERAEIFLNGKKVASITDWGDPAKVDVARQIVVGENVIAARCEPGKSRRGLVVRLETGTNSSLVSDTTWLCSDHEARGWNKTGFDASGWKPAVSLADLGDKPWGDVFTPRQATAAGTLRVMPGFKVELLHSASASEGTWIAMAVDPQGRFIVSPQRKSPLLRLTISGGHLAKIERLTAPVSSAMGLLYAENSLYVDGSGPKGWGLYRLPAIGNDFGPPEFLRPFSANGEHGSHVIVLGPDHKLYIVCGNFTQVPSDVLPDSPHRHYADDQLLPRAEDGNGFGAGLKPPGGMVVRMDLDGTHCELFAAGTRNTYSIAFDPDGELFGFDSDMEWDWGTAWYRPIRVNLWVPGGDYGFREGSGKFPEYYEDTLPSLRNIGIGSPTGVMFGTRSRFPEKYRQAFWMEDWTYGRLFAVQLTPRGASYEASPETIVRGIPLNLTSLQFGRDGALYFITGGRDIQSGLYRLTYTGPKIKDPPKTSAELASLAAAREARALRRDLEFFDGKPDRNAVDLIWPCLGNEDRWIRYAARIALESQDLSWWQDRALAETNTIGGLTALLAVARIAGPEAQPALLQALKKFPIAGLNQEQELLKLRVLEVSFARQGRPSGGLDSNGLAELDALYPSTNQWLNRELCQLAIYLRLPDAVPKTMALLEKAPTQEEQTCYLMRLRNVPDGWTMDLRQQYLAWFKKDRDHIKHPPEILQYFKDVERDYSDGASFPKFLENFKREFADALTVADRDALADYLPKETNAGYTVDPNRKFVKDWTMQDLQPHLDKLKSARSFDAGKTAYTQAQCILCHRFGKSGGSVGPELAAVSSRLASRDILESILEPSKVVSEQYQNTRLTLKDGDEVAGRVISEDDDKLVLEIEPIHQTRTDIRKADIESRRVSKVSPMPEGLVNFMTEDQIWDLIAYLQSSGKKTFAAFQK